MEEALPTCALGLNRPYRGHRIATRLVGRPTHMREAAGDGPISMELGGGPSGPPPITCYKYPSFFSPAAPEDASGRRDASAIVAALPAWAMLSRPAGFFGARNGPCASEDLGAGYVRYWHDLFLCYLWLLCGSNTTL